MDGDEEKKLLSDSAERLREVVLDLHVARERERELREEATAVLAGLTAITDATSPSEVFAKLFDELRGSFDFAGAMVLRAAGSEGVLVAETATDPVFVGARFNVKKAFDRALHGRVSTHVSTASIPEWQEQSAEIRARVGSALCLPLHGEQERGLLVFTRPEERAFQPRHEQLARRFLPLVTQALRDAERRAQLTRANRDMRLVLDNVAQGLLMVSPSCTIVGERSAIVDRWFGPVDPGTTLDALVARKSPALAERLARAWADLRTGTDPVELRLARLPREMEADDVVLRIDYQPVPTPEQWQHVLVVLSDVTAEIERARLQMQAKDARRRNELSIAQHVQTSILPKSLQAPGLEIAARMLPAEEVGGDYYDVISVEDGCWIAIGDVSGHGLRAGLLMLMVQSAILTLVSENGAASPRDVVCATNKMLFENGRARLREDDHMTLSAIRYHVDGAIELAGAHEEPVIFRAARGKCEIQPTHGTWVGAMPDVAPFTTVTKHHLEPGDILWLYTDGLIEAKNDRGRQFGIERLCEIIEAHHGEPISDIRDRLIEALLAWSPVPADDVTLLGARYLGPPR